MAKNILFLFSFFPAPGVSTGYRCSLPVRGFVYGLEWVEQIEKTHTYIITIGVRIRTALTLKNEAVWCAFGEGRFTIEAACLAYDAFWGWAVAWGCTAHNLPLQAKPTTAWGCEVPLGRLLTGCFFFIPF